MPRESLIYLGDTARLPYGPKSPDTVRRYALQIATWLVEQGVKCIVIACNTATAHALAFVQARLDVPVIGVIQPGARAAVNATRVGTIGVIGTLGTIQSGAYEAAIHRIDPTARVRTRACPLFVPLVEEGWLDHAVTRAVAEEYLAELRNAGLESLILGCTHYPMLAPMLAKLMGPGVALIDSGVEAARATAHLLAERGQLAAGGAGTKPPAHHFFLSDEPRRRSFATVAQAFLGRPLPHVTVVDQTDLPWFERPHRQPTLSGGDPK